jgi:Flp pilus assembly protein TadD
MCDEIYSHTSTTEKEVVLDLTLVSTSTLDLGGKICPPGEKMSNTYDLYQKGKQHLADGMPAQAIVSLEKAKRLEPRKASIREALGIAYLRLGRFEEAATEFRAMVDITPTDAYGYYGLGRSLARLGRSAEARGQLKLAMMLSPLKSSPGRFGDDS